MKNIEQFPEADNFQNEGMEDAMTQRLEALVEPAMQLADLKQEIEVEEVEPEPEQDGVTDIQTPSVSTEVLYDAINETEMKAEGNMVLDEIVDVAEKEGTERASSGAGESTVV